MISGQQIADEIVRMRGKAAALRDEVERAVLSDADRRAKEAQALVLARRSAKVHLAAQMRDNADSRIAPLAEYASVAVAVKVEREARLSAVAKRLDAGPSLAPDARHALEREAEELRFEIDSIERGPKQLSPSVVAFSPTLAAALAARGIAQLSFGLTEVEHRIVELRRQHAEATATLVRELGLAQTEPSAARAEERAVV
jgi:hypothetical protein